LIDIIDYIWCFLSANNNLSLQRKTRRDKHYTQHGNNCGMIEMEQEQYLSNAYCIPVIILSLSLSLPQFPGSNSR
jgi:hypothetical protein